MQTGLVSSCLIVYGNGLVTPYGDIDLCQYWLVYNNGVLLDDIKPLPGLSLMGFCGTNLKPILRDVLKIPILDISLNHTLVNIYFHIPKRHMS